MALRPRMTSWYNPAELAKTGIRVAISTVFGQFADRREALAAANAIEPQPFDASFNYEDKKGKDGLWFDFLADTGDGWNATYAMARLLAQDSIDVGERILLPRGRLLVMGGDQVYPTASREEYGKRLLDPFEQARLRADSWPDPRPDLYAIPGNHDWYDGLNSFFGLFCRRRVKAAMAEARDGKLIGGRQTQQTRSYFAVELPGNWWIWGTDSQLEGYIDQPQIDFFIHVATNWMKPDAKVILCVGEPSWVYAKKNKPEIKFNSFSYLEWLVERVERGHQLKVVLTGDSHHYARYTEEDRHYIVCGGGGAFLHPTHQLTDNSFRWPHKKPGGADTGTRDFALKHRYPAFATSFLLTFRNLLFPLLNPAFTLFHFLGYGVFNWLLHVNAKVTAGTMVNGTPSPPSLVQSLRVDRFGDAASAYAHLLLTSPWPALLMATSFAGYYYFAPIKNRVGRAAVGLVHWAAQTFTAIAVTWLVIQATPPGLGASCFPDWITPGLAPILLGTVAAAVASSLVIGAYLLAMLNIFGLHFNEAFSSLRIAGYKSMLRMRITPDGDLEIHPIGLRRTPFEWPWQTKTNRDTPLKPHAIEPPLTVR